MRFRELVEDAYSAGFSDGQRGQQDPRASSKYGPEMNQYMKGFQAGTEQDKKIKQDRVAKKAAAQAPYEKMSTDELKQLFSDLRKKQADHIQALRDLYNGRSYDEMKKIDPDFDEKIQKLQDKFGDMKELNNKIETVNQVLYKKGVRESATAGATSAGNIAAVANPTAATAKIKRDKNGVPKAPQKTNKDGTAKNALDVDNNIMGGKAVKR